MKWFNFAPRTMGVNWPILTLILLAASGLVVMNIIAMRNNKKAREYTSLQQIDFLSLAELIALYRELESRKMVLQQWANIAVVDYKWNDKLCYESRPHEFSRENIAGGVMLEDVSEADPEQPFEYGILFGYNMNEEPVYERHYHSLGVYSEVFRVKHGRTQEHIRISIDGKSDYYSRLVFDDEQLLSWEELSQSGVRHEVITWKDKRLHTIITSEAGWAADSLDTPVETTAYEADYSAVGRMLGLKVVDTKTQDQRYISLDESNT